MATAMTIDARELSPPQNCWEFQRIPTAQELLSHIQLHITKDKDFWERINTETPSLNTKKLVANHHGKLTQFTHNKPHFMRQIYIIFKCGINKSKFHKKREDILIIDLKDIHKAIKQFIKKLHFQWAHTTYLLLWKSYESNQGVQALRASRSGAQ